jgi:hypothetical protein
MELSLALFTGNHAESEDLPRTGVSIVGDAGSPEAQPPPVNFVDSRCI